MRVGGVDLCEEVGFPTLTRAYKDSTLIMQFLRDLAIPRCADVSRRARRDNFEREHATLLRGVVGDPWDEA